MKKIVGTRGLLAACLLFLGLLAGLAVYQFRSPDTAPAGGEARPEGAPVPEREAILYFASQDGSRLVPETRNLAGCRDQENCLKATVEALIQGSAAGLFPVIPAQAVVLSVREEGGMAVADFSADLQKGHPGGSMSELLTVYALADTLASNFPHIRQVRILIEGAEVESLKGHVDLRRPVQVNFGLVRPQEGEVGRGGKPRTFIIEQEVTEGSPKR